MADWSVVNDDCSRRGFEGVERESPSKKAKEKTKTKVKVKIRK
jgi:hypothetical protein